MSGGEAEAGGAYRAAIAAYIATYILRGEPLRELQLVDSANAIPTTVELETDDPVDDIGVCLVGGGRAFIQSKRTLTYRTAGEGSLVSAIDQCKEVVRTMRLDANRDRLVVAAGNVSGPIRDLAAALDRARNPLAAGPSEREDRALKKLSRLLDDIRPELRDVLLNCLVIWELDVEGEASPASKNAQHGLESGIVIPSDGFNAWRSLRDACRNAAHMRGGFDAEGLLQVLRSANLHLIADKDGLLAAQLTARLAATERYRLLVSQAGQTLDLLGLGAGLPPIPIEAIDASIRVRASDEKEGKERDLSWAMRRQGRLVLLGLPGSGKSTMLKMTASYFAQRDDWPVPVYIELDRLARRLDTQGFRDALLNVAVERLELDSNSAAQVRDIIEDGLSSGRLALFLDALDETRERRYTVVQSLRQFLSMIHEDVEVVLSTREVAYADAHTLGFPTMVMSAPRNSKRTVRRILEAAAEHREIAELERPVWVRERYYWVQVVLGSNAALRETPLVPVLLALLASNHSGGDLPRSRATIVAAVLKDVVATWESAQRRRGQVRLGALTQERATKALLEALPIEGNLVDQHGSLPRSSIEEELSSYFRGSFSLGQADSEVAASEALACWDEAGIFVVSSDGAITARLRLFAEIGAAMYAHGLEDDELGRWVMAACSDENRAETLRLAAGLDSRVAGLLYENACLDLDVNGQDRLLLVLANALAEGAILSDDLLAERTRRLLGLLSTTATVWQVTLAIARMPVPTDLREEVRSAFATCLPEPNLPTVEALATLRWQEVGDDADRRLEAVLQGVRPVSMVTGRRSGLVDAGFSEAFVGAAQRLRSKGTKALEVIGEALGRGSGSDDEQIQEILSDEGRSDLVAKYYRAQMAKWRETIKSDWFNDVDLRLLGFIRDLAETRGLTQRETRRLDDLCDFVSSLHIPNAAAQSLAQSVAEAPERVKTFLSSVAPLTGLDLSAVATEAQVMIELLKGPDEDQARSALWAGGVDRKLTHWDTIEKRRELRRLLRDILNWLDWPAWPAALALSSVPERKETLAELDAAIDHLRPWSRNLVCRLMVFLEGDNLDRSLSWLRDKDPLRRLAAAKHIASAVNRDPLARRAFEDALADPDEGVREAALKGLAPLELNDPLLPRVRAVVLGDPASWYCLWCDSTNHYELASCSSCKIVGPDAAEAAVEVFRVIGVDPPEASGDRRHHWVLNLDDLSDHF